MAQYLIRSMTDDYAEYLRDESRTNGKAESISFPTTERDIKRIVDVLRRNQTPITLQGARTGLAAGAVPLQGHIMNMSRMDRITGMRRDQQGQFYISLQPGVVLSQLKKMIELKSFDDKTWSNRCQKTYAEFCDAPEQFFSPDPTEASASLGGMVACNASGARSYRYGSVRSYVTYLRVVLTSGEILEIRRGENLAKGRNLELRTDAGKVLNITLPRYQMPNTKNASGYYVEDDMDAIDLFIGSDGTLGIISEIEIKLLDMPRVVWGVACFFQQEQRVLDFVVEIRSVLTEIASIEYFDEDALEILRKQKKAGHTFAQLPEIDRRYKAAAYLEIHSSSEEMALEELKKIETIMEKVGGDAQHTWVAQVDVDKDRLLFFRHAIPESVNRLIDEGKKFCPGLTKLGTDMAVPDQFLYHIVKVYRESLKSQGLRSAVWGHIGNNHLHVNLLPKNEKEYEIGKKLYAEWATIVTELGGAVSAEHGVGKLKADFLKQMYGDKAIDEMKKLKNQFDANGMLGHGNLFSFSSKGGVNP